MGPSNSAMAMAVATAVVMALETVASLCTVNIFSLNLCVCELHSGSRVDSVE